MEVDAEAGAVSEPAGAAAHTSSKPYDRYVMYSSEKRKGFQHNSSVAAWGMVVSPESRPAARHARQTSVVA